MQNARQRQRPDTSLFYCLVNALDNGRKVREDELGLISSLWWWFYRYKRERGRKNCFVTYMELGGLVATSRPYSLLGISQSHLAYLCWRFGYMIHCALSIHPFIVDWLIDPVIFAHATNATFAWAPHSIISGAIRPSCRRVFEWISIWCKSRPSC